MYAYNNRLGLKEVASREEAIAWNNQAVEQTEDNIVDARDNYLTTYTDTPYLSLSHTYEAMILYIIHRVNEEYDDYAQYTRIAQIFTLALMNYYNNQHKGYTREKPIKVGNINRRYIGFQHYSEYWQHLKSKGVIQSRWQEYTKKNGDIGESQLFWTEIPRGEVKKLVDDTKMIRHIDSAVHDGRYASHLSEEIHRTYNRLGKKWKLRGGE